jgi:leucyl-tRNA synthetase
MRVYEMFMGPLEQSAPWQTAGLAGVHRFLQRIHRLCFGDSGEEGTPRQLVELAEGEGTDRQRRLLHRTIHEVTDRVERLAFNTAIASMMVFVRDITGEKGGPTEPLARGAAESFARLLSPFAPHLAEEIWSALGHDASLAAEPWPQADPALLVDDSFALVVQVNGKRRAEIQAPKSAGKDELAALARSHEAVQKHLDGGEPRRVIVVPGRLVNFVV